jgi:hypothetical protein
MPCLGLNASSGIKVPSLIMEERMKLFILLSLISMQDQSPTLGRTGLLPLGAPRRPPGPASCTVRSRQTMSLEFPFRVSSGDYAGEEGLETPWIGGSGALSQPTTFKKPLRAYSWQGAGYGGDTYQWRYRTCGEAV